MGHALPGWTMDGQRKPGDWNKAEPKRKMYKELYKCLRDAAYFPAGRAEFVALPDAPGIDKYMERARSALP